MTDRSAWVAAVIAALVLGASPAESAGLCNLEGAHVLAGTDGIGGTGLSGDDDGIGGTGHSDEDGIGGTGISSTDGIGGTGISDEDGIGGTGIYGTLTRFGSLCVNGVRITLGEKTRYQRNGEASDLGDLAVGQVLWIQAQDTPEGLRARSVEAFSAVIGTVASVDAESRTIVVGGQTVLLGHSENGGEKLTSSLPRVGDLVDVSGLRNEDEEIVVSRIELLDETIAPYRAPGLRELIDAAPELRALSVEGFLGPEIGPDRFRLAGIQVEAPELASLSANTRIWLTGGRVGQNTLAVRRAEFAPSSAVDSQAPISPDGSREPIELPGLPTDEPKKSDFGKPSVPLLLAPSGKKGETLVVPIVDGELEGVEIRPEAEVAVELEVELEIEPIVDDTLIDSLIDLDPAISTDAAIPEALGTDSLDARDRIPSAESSILVPDAIEKTREKFDIPVQIESIDLDPRMDSPKPVKGD
ncbi:MAG: DUF5666 domain-containing protein [Myxococcota bacterium]|nr:DUF5666 domain-containing protein [Myxococcota bacterium]